MVTLDEDSGDSDIGVGTLIVEKRNQSLVGVQKPDASETTKVAVPTDPRRRDDCSRQARCVPTTDHDESHRRTGRDTEVSKTDRRVLVATSIFEVIFRSKET
jgi:hypothetical protein